MPITSNTVQNNQGRSGNLNTTAAKRTYRAAGSNVTVREGETLKGVVSDIHGNEITISLEDGSSFTGKLPEASQYSIGQKAAFLITNLENGTIYMKAISQAYLLGMEDTIEQALEEAGLPKSPRNLDIVRSLLENQQSISKESINASLHLCAKYPEVDVNSVITMKRLGLPMNESTVTQFDQYQNQTHSLLARMDSLTDSINHLLTDLSKENPAIARYAANETLNIALQSMPSLEELQLATTRAEAQAAEVLAMEGADGNEAIPGALAEELVETAEGNLPNPLTGEEGDAISDSPFAKMKQLFSSIAERATASTATLTEEASTFIPEQSGHLLTGEERIALSDLLGKFINDETMLATLKDGDMTARELLTLIKNSLPQIPDQELSDLMSSKGFQKILKGQFSSNWTLSPEGLQEEGSVENLYGKMQEQFSELTNLSRMFATRPAGEAMVHTTTDMQQNMEFMKMLNEQFTYMQLPMKLSEQNAHGDLYVMTRKNALKRSKDNLKVLLHLEMDSLGPLDIHITKEHTNISTKFYVAKEPARKLLEKNANLLRESLNDKGFSFSSEFLAKEKNIDLVNDFMEQEKAAPVGSMTRYNFDLRA